MNQEQLSDKQIEICKELLETKGCFGWKRITAKKLVVAETTIKTHLIAIFQKLQVDSQTELMHKLLTTSDWRLPKWRKKEKPLPISLKVTVSDLEDTEWKNLLLKNISRATGVSEENIIEQPLTEEETTNGAIAKYTIKES